MVKHSNKILILTGHSGAGKDTVSAELQARGHFAPITPHSTRSMREGESEGDPYYFISVDQFHEMINTGQFIEYASYTTQFNNIPNTAYYGTAYSSISNEHPSVITIGVLAGIELKKQLGDRATLVYLHVNDSIREDRAKARGSFDQIEWDNRLAQDHARFANGLPEGIDFEVNNMQPLGKTVQDILDVCSYAL